VLAFALGLAAQRLRVSPIAGYLLASIAVGPFTPGFVADQDLANQLAEIGVILLMLAVGLHFSLDDLMSVRARSPCRARSRRSPRRRRSAWRWRGSSDGVSARRG